MIVDIYMTAIGEFAHGMAGQMNFADGRGRQIVQHPTQPDSGFFAKIGGGDGHVVDVEQQTAAASPCQPCQEFAFAHLAAGEGKVDRRILDQNGSAERRLHAVDIAGKNVLGLARVWEGQQIGKMHATEALQDR